MSLHSCTVECIYNKHILGHGCNEGYVLEYLSHSRASEIFREACYVRMCMYCSNILLLLMNPSKLVSTSGPLLFCSCFLLPWLLLIIEVLSPFISFREDFLIIQSKGSAFYPNHCPSFFAALFCSQNSLSENTFFLFSLFTYYLSLTFYMWMVLYIDRH